MEQEKIQHFKHKLLEERKQLESELSGLGIKNPDNREDWEATPGTIDETATEKDEIADRYEEFEERRGILATLEARWNDVKDALRKIEEGVYGTDEATGEEIPEERLEANPAARTANTE